MNGFKLRDIEIWSKAMGRAGFKTTAWSAAGVEPARGDEEGSVRLNASASCLDGTQVTIALVFDCANALMLHDKIMKNLLGSKSRTTLLGPTIASSVEAWVNGERQIDAGQAGFQMMTVPGHWRFAGPYPYAAEGQGVWSLGFYLDDTNARIFAELLRITPFQAPGR